MVLGKGRWNTRGSYSNTVTGGGIDILLTANLKEPLRGRHARLLHSLESYTFATDKKLRVGDSHLNPTNVSAFGQRKAAIAFSDLEYALAFTNLDQSILQSSTSSALATP